MNVASSMGSAGPQWELKLYAGDNVGWYEDLSCAPLLPCRGSLCVRATQGKGAAG